MKQGDEIIYSIRGFGADGNPIDEQGVELLKFDRFITTDSEVKLVGSNKDNVLRVVPVDYFCKLVDPARSGNSLLG